MSTLFSLSEPDQLFIETQLTPFILLLNRLSGTNDTPLHSSSFAEFRILHFLGILGILLNYIYTLTPKDPILNKI